MNDYNFPIQTGTIIRTAFLAVALINQILTSTGHSVLPFDDDMIAQVISVSATVITSAVAWWKNNDFTINARKAGAYLRGLRGYMS